MPSRTITTVIECAGNRRAFFRPRVYGEQWHEGAVGQTIWKGVPLNFLLSIAGIKDTALEVVFEGHDSGSRTDIPGIFAFVRSLPLSKALLSDTIIAYEMNGKTLPFKHGYPLRLIVPGWYGMAWVKWLKRISLIGYEFSGPFQAVDYNYYPFKNSYRNKRPVNTIRLNSLIQYPLNWATLKRGDHQITGLAWTGDGLVAAVEVSADQGETWKEATVRRDSSQPYSWVYWHYHWRALKKGEYTIFSRACDSGGGCQPAVPEWNQKGYGFNAIAVSHVKVE